MLHFPNIDDWITPETALYSSSNEITKEAQYITNKAAILAYLASAQANKFLGFSNKHVNSKDFTYQRMREEIPRLLVNYKDLLLSEDPNAIKYLESIFFQKYAQAPAGIKGTCEKTIQMQMDGSQSAESLGVPNKLVDLLKTAEQLKPIIALISPTFFMQQRTRAEKKKASIEQCDRVAKGVGSLIAAYSGLYAGPMQKEQSLAGAAVAQLAY